MIEHINSLQNFRLDNSWLTIGVFDGVHLGHQTILRKLANGAKAANLPSVVITFHPHPALVIGKKQGALTLTTPDERVAIMDDFGIDIAITYPFDRDTALTTAVEFIILLKSHLNFTWLGMGYDFALGKGRQGNVEFLSALSQEYNYQLEVFPPVEMEGNIISSSQIRAKLREGDVSGAARMLGRSYSLSGEVVQGDGRGRTIGIPTANLTVNPDRLIPLAGVYACRAIVGDTVKAAAVNIGNRPTFDGEQAHSWVEAHLLDFSGNLYGTQIRLEFVERLRAEQRFSSVGDLINQINLDIDKTRLIMRD